MAPALVWQIMAVMVMTNALQAQPPPGTDRIDHAGYTGCVLLENADTRVILEPNCGGRVLAYAWKGENAIAVDPAQNGWTWTPGGETISPPGGRMDIGPEMLIPKHPALWLGRWQAEIIGPRAARLTSQPDEPTGVQLVREFRLAADSSRLTVTQTIRNVSAETKHWSHWSRTMARGGGICLVPLTPDSRFPMGYVTYEPGYRILGRPGREPNVRVRDGFLEILDTTVNPKFGFDSSAGWFAYLMTNDLMFVKRFPVYPDRLYGEVAGLTASIYYMKDVMCELEPIGPKNDIAPGESASYTEDWWLLPYPFPQDRTAVDLKQVAEIVDQQAR
jgi:hypothetical protein